MNTKKIRKNASLGAVIRYLEEMHASADESAKALTRAAINLEWGNPNRDGNREKASIHFDYSRQIEEALLHLDRINNR